MGENKNTRVVKAYTYDLGIGDVITDAFGQREGLVVSVPVWDVAAFEVTFRVEDADGAVREVIRGSERPVWIEISKPAQRVVR